MNYWGQMRFLILSTLVVVALGAIALTSALSADSVTTTACGPVRGGDEASSRLRVVGTQMQDSAGKPFIPYGISVVSGPDTKFWIRNAGAAAAQIAAANRYWHVNTIRLQVSETLLFQGATRKRPYNVRFARSVDRLVCAILTQGNVPVINDMTLFTGHRKGPTEDTIRFWRFMGKRYGNRFPVIFDLYNEPQVTRSARTDRFLRSGTAWRVWRDGAVVGGVHYVGMQRLVDDIRIRQRVRNVIWAEEPYYLTADRARLGLLPHFLLKGEDIMYTFHKPSMIESSQSYRDVRAMVDRGIPLVDSEWGQFAATDRPWMCQPDAYTSAPPYLAYLRSKSIGMLSWSLQPGSLVKGVPGKDTVQDGNDLRFSHDPTQLALPSEMGPDYACTRKARGQGAGRLVMDYFARYAERPSPDLFPKISH
jgi:hypothetical protein